jgi:hypothetical protein
MSDRFDLEQQILDCWKITDDIKLLSDQDAVGSDYKSLVTVYEYKFEKLWQIFENMGHTRQFSNIEKVSESVSNQG